MCASIGTGEEGCSPLVSGQVKGESMEFKKGDVGKCRNGDDAICVADTGTSHPLIWVRSRDGKDFGCFSTIRTGEQCGPDDKSPRDVQPIAKTMRVPYDESTFNFEWVRYANGTRRSISEIREHGITIQAVTGCNNFSYEKLMDMDIQLAYISAGPWHPPYREVERV